MYASVNYPQSRPGPTPLPMCQDEWSKLRRQKQQRIEDEKHKAVLANILKYTGYVPANIGYLADQYCSCVDPLFVRKVQGKYQYVTWSDLTFKKSDYYCAPRFIRSKPIIAGDTPDGNRAGFIMSYKFH